MSTFCRKTYNSKYYAQNRERIKKRRQGNKGGDQPRSQHFEEPGQLSLFENSTHEFETLKRFQTPRIQYVINGLLFLLVIANSYYLLGEAVEFYRSSNASVETSLLAAIIVELLLLALSVIQTTSLMLKIASKAALSMLFAYSAWSVCSSVISQGCGTLGQLESLENRRERLESRIKEQRVLIEENLRRQRITMARKLMLEKDQFIGALAEIEKEHEMKKATSPAVLKFNMIAMVALRLLLQFSNIIIVHHLSSLMGRHSTKRRAPRVVAKAAPVFQLIHSAAG